MSNKVLLQRVSVVGASGSGKSVFARHLARISNLPVIELDTLRWDEEGNLSGDEQFRADVAEAAGRESWIIDGHYRAVRHLVWRRAETVVWLNYSMRVVLAGMLGRYFNKRRTFDGPASPKVGWMERLQRLRRTMIERREYARVLHTDTSGYGQVVELRTREAAEAWLREIAVRTEVKL